MHGASRDSGRGLGDGRDVRVQDGDTGRLQRAEKGHTSLSENLNDKRREKTVYLEKDGAKGRLLEAEGLKGLRMSTAGGKEASERETVRRHKTEGRTRHRLVEGAQGEASPLRGKGLSHGESRAVTEAMGTLGDNVRGRGGTSRFRVQFSS